MTPIRLVLCILLTLFLACTLPAGQTTALAALPPALAEPDGGQESIAGSYVYLNHVISPDDCSDPGQVQTFCFQAISYTSDWDYVYYLWQRFPEDWTVNNVFVQGEPYCTSGGTFGPFSWSAPSPYEVRIQHVRYHANPSDTCTAYYCFDVTSGSHSPGVPYTTVPWYWISSAYGALPFYPCSSDGYTPAGQPACDEMISGVAVVWRCGSVHLPIVLKGHPPR